jgi:subtilisin family serine protease
MLLGICGCTASPSVRQAALLPEAARIQPERYVVVTIRNPRDSLSIHAASTPRGYDGPGTYKAGSLARLQANQLARQYGLAETATWPIKLLDVHCIVYRVSPGIDRSELLARLALDPRVESAESLQTFGVAAIPSGDPYRPLQANLDALDLRSTGDTDGGRGVTVAIIDTGFDVNHPDLRTSASRMRNFVDDDVAAFRHDSHGAAVAGVIAAVPNNGIGIAGIAPGANLLAYKACWHPVAGVGAVCNSFTLAQALAAAIDAHADIINLSLAGPADALLTRLVAAALARGTIVVGAVPPDGSLATFPAVIDGVIAVDAIENARSAGQAFKAPGRDILSHAPDGRYDFYSGSSLATAELSGIAALLRAEDPGLNGERAARLLRSSVQDTLAADGIPSACRALSALSHRDRCVPH